MIKGLFFDQDGVIIDTERDGHRVVFNRVFKEAGLDIPFPQRVVRLLKD